MPEDKDKDKDKKPEPLGPGAPTKGHPSMKRAGGFYVNQTHRDSQSLSYLAMQEGLSSNPREGMKDKDGNPLPSPTDELIEKVGKKKARKMIEEAERAWGIPEKGLKGFIKRRLG